MPVIPAVRVCDTPPMLVEAYCRLIPAGSLSAMRNWHWAHVARAKASMTIASVGMPLALTG